MHLLKMSGLQIWLCLFTFRPIVSKQLNGLTTIDLTQWCSGNASALGARGPGFNPRLRQGFLCLIFCFVVVVFLLFVQKHIIIPPPQNVGGGILDSLCRFVRSVGPSVRLQFVSAL